MTSSRILRSAVAAVALMATASSFALAQGGRLSLAERVERLERQQQGSAADTQQQASSVDLLNRITQLQTEVQVLRGMIEEQDFKLNELERRNRDLAAPTVIIARTSLDESPAMNIQIHWTWIVCCPLWFINQ